MPSRAGLQASHRLEEVIDRGDAARAITAQRHAATLPRLSGQAGYTRTNHVEAFGVLLPNNQLRVIYPDIPDNYRDASRRAMAVLHRRPPVGARAGGAG